MASVDLNENPDRYEPTFPAGQSRELFLKSSCVVTADLLMDRAADRER
jgi:hypothetical protein